MRNRSSILAAGLLALCAPYAAVAQGHNPGTPDGTQGHDWDAQAFQVENGHLAVITAVNVSKGGPSSTAGFDVYVDGTRIDKFTIGGLAVAKAYVLDRPGRHNVLIVCTNNAATMVACRLGTMRGDDGIDY